MAERVEIFDLAILAGTPASSPQDMVVGFPPGIVDRVQFVFPDGCAGLVGVRFAYAGQVIIPYSEGAWLRGNDEVVDWPLDAYPGNGQWTLLAYNTDVYTHVLQLRWLLTETASVVAVPGPVPVIAPEIIEQAAAPAAA